MPNISSMLSASNQPSCFAQATQICIPIVSRSLTLGDVDLLGSGRHEACFPCPACFASSYNSLPLSTSTSTSTFSTLCTHRQHHKIIAKHPNRAKGLLFLSASAIFAPVDSLSLMFTRVQLNQCGASSLAYRFFGTRQRLSFVALAYTDVWKFAIQWTRVHACIPGRWL